MSSAARPVKRRTKTGFCPTCLKGCDTFGGICLDCKGKVFAIAKAAVEVAKRKANAAAERKALAIVYALRQTGHCLGSGSARTAEDLEDEV